VIDVKVFCKKKRFRVTMTDGMFSKLKEDISSVDKFLRIGELLLVSKDEIVYIDAEKIPDYDAPEPKKKKTKQ
jgi:hypothetical protein